MGGPTAEVNPTRCEAIGFCTQVAPTVFRLGDGPPVQVVVEGLDDDQVDQVAEAQGLCPTQAILLRD